LGARKVERGEDLRLVIVRVFRRERLEGFRPGQLPGPLRAIGPVLVVRGDRFHVVALALGLGRRAPRIVDRRLGLFRAVGRRARTRKRIRHQDRRVAPGGHGAAGVLREDVGERLLGERVPEGVQHGDAALESRLDRGGARGGEGDLSELAAWRVTLVGAGSKG